MKQNGSSNPVLIEAASNVIARRKLARALFEEVGSLENCEAMANWLRDRTDQEIEAMCALRDAGMADLGSMTDDELRDIAYNCECEYCNEESAKWQMK